MAVVQDVVIVAQLVIVSAGIFYMLGQDPPCVSTEHCFECGKAPDELKRENSAFYNEKKMDKMNEQEQKLCACLLNRKLKPISKRIFVILCIAHGFSFVVVLSLERKYITRPPTTPYIILFCLGISFISSALLINRFVGFTQEMLYSKDTANSRSLITNALLAPFERIAKSLFTLATDKMAAIFSYFLTSGKHFDQMHKSLTLEQQELLCPYTLSATEDEAIKVVRFQSELATLSLSYLISFVYITYLTFSTLSEISKTKVKHNEYNEKPFSPPCKLCEMLKKLKTCRNEEIDGRCKSQDSDDESFVMGWRL